MVCAAARAAGRVSAVREGMTGWPMSAMASLKSWRSSLFKMASMFVPMSRTPCALRKPDL